MYVFSVGPGIGYPMISLLYSTRFGHIRWNIIHHTHNCMHDAGWECCRTQVGDARALFYLCVEDIYIYIYIFQDGIP